MDKQFLSAEIASAMRAHDKPRLSILRLVKNEIDTKEKESGSELAPEDVVAALKKVLKQTGETLEASEKAGTNAERTALLKQQVEILSGYLPAQVTGDELAAIVERVIAEGGLTEKRDMGRAIGRVVAECGGNCDKAEVARLVGARLG
ncbi:MAG: GatB/YqeY domain-containing protein [Anaerosomatales bacterium]|nr:GatB/YqeY domain-containing protein [Anaerosomatales bacterium]